MFYIIYIRSVPLITNLSEAVPAFGRRLMHTAYPHVFRNLDQYFHRSDYAAADMREAACCGALWLISLKAY